MGHSPCLAACIVWCQELQGRARCESRLQHLLHPGTYECTRVLTTTPSLTTNHVPRQRQVSCTAHAMQRSLPLNRGPAARGPLWDCHHACAACRFPCRVGLNTFVHSTITS